MKIGAHPYFWKHLDVVFLEVLKPGQLFWDVKVSPDPNVLRKQAGGL